MVNDIGPQNVEEISYTVKDKQGHKQGEIDVIEGPNSFKEAKSTFTDAHDYDKKVDALGKSNKYALDGSTMTWRAESVPDVPTMLKKAKEAENRAKKKWNADIDIKIHDESTGKTHG